SDCFANTIRPHPSATPFPYTTLLRSDGEHTWTYKKDLPGEYVIHITKKEESDPALEDTSIVNSFDVRPHPPAKRHDMVFDAFDELKAGEAFVVINDHDPKPLYYQMEAENDEPFKWEYLETM